MSFNAMVEDLIAKGLLTKDRQLTPKGHEYVEQIKKKYSAETKPFTYDEEGEPHDTRTREPEGVPKQDCVTS